MQEADAAARGGSCGPTGASAAERACELASIPSEAAWRFDGHQFGQVEIADRL